MSSFGAAGAGFTLPLFIAKALGFQQDAVEAQAKQALAEYEQTVLTAFREVEDALVAAEPLANRTKRSNSKSMHYNPRFSSPSFAIKADWRTISMCSWRAAVCSKPNWP